MSERKRKEGREGGRKKGEEGGSKTGERMRERHEQMREIETISHTSFSVP
jgi:hypothetical protein